MKKLTTIFCLSFLAILIPGSCFSQYIPLLKNNASWHVYHWFESGWNETQQLTGDTVINNLSYKILSSNSSGQGPFFLREDTATKKIYQFLNSTEFLLYDFSLPIGSIFIYNNPQTPSWTPHLRLDSVTSTIDPLFFNQATDWTTIVPLRVYYFTDTEPGAVYQILWVEGLGSLSGLLLPANSWGGGALGETLLCHNSIPDTIDYHFVFWEEPNPCEGPIMSLDNPERNQCKIYPVPATSTVTIEMDQSVTGNITVRISDILGNPVKTMVTDSRKLIIDVEDLSEGIYFITLTDQAGFSFSQKMIKSGLSL
jgi:hypothetical protein